MVIIISALFIKSSKPFKNILIIALLLTFISIASAGFFIPLYETPILVQTFASINFLRIQFESLIIILFKKRCQSIPIVFNYLGINESQLIPNLYFLIIEGIIFRFIGIIIMIFQSNSRYIFKKSI